MMTALVLRRPHPDECLYQQESTAHRKEGTCEFIPREMLHRSSFWPAFLCLVFLSAVGSTVISFARDLSPSVGAETGLATTLVGVLSVCNGLGRLIVGSLFDRIGCRKTMILANVTVILAAGITLMSICSASLTMCIVGLCITGLSYGACPTIISEFTAEFYGMKYFPMNFNLVGASIMATVVKLRFGWYHTHDQPTVFPQIFRQSGE